MQPLIRGGTNAPLTAVAGGIVYGTSTAMAIGSAGAAGQILVSGGAGAYTWGSAGSGGIGTVTSVALALPGIFTVSGSPVTGAGTLTGTLATQAANKIWAGPITGADAAPTFRALDPADVPTLNQSTTGSAATVTGFNPTSGKTLSILKTMSLTAADDTGVYTLPTGTKTLLATDGSAASLTSFPTLNQDTSGNAGTVTNGVYTSGSYADPGWITSLAKSKVGLSSVENTALSTWAGTTNLTTLGAVGTGTWNAGAITATGAHNLIGATASTPGRVVIDDDGFGSINLKAYSWMGGANYAGGRVGVSTDGASHPTLVFEAGTALGAVGAETLYRVLTLNGQAQKATVHGNMTATTFTGDLTGNVTGNCSGTAATVTGAAQTAITSVGTLTSLTSSGQITGTLGVFSGTDATITAGILTATYTGGANAGLALRHIHTGIIATEANDGVGVDFKGYDGSAHRNMAGIYGKANGETVSSTSSPGYLAFYATASGSVSYAERMRLTSAALSPAASGGITLGTASLPWGSAYMGALSAGAITSSGVVKGTSFEQTTAANAVSPTSPNRTITVVCNGVTLYIAAKTTND